MKYMMILGCVPEGIELTAESLSLMFHTEVEIKISAVITTDSPEAARAMEGLYGCYKDAQDLIEDQKGKVQ